VNEAYERRWEERGGRRRAGRTAADEARTSYYGVPPIHRAPWKWEIVAYFYLGGISGASYALAGLAQLAGDDQNGRIVRAGRYLSLATLVPCPFLLILDLGRPERFYRMLRILKLRSPMSPGTWGLVVFSGFSALSASVQAAQDGVLGEGALARGLGRVPACPLGAAGTVPAFFLTGYTGVLLGATAVPLWAKNALLLGPLFVSSALSTATAAIALILAADGRTPPATMARLDRVESLALTAELGLLAGSLAKLGPTAQPLATGRLGQLFRWGVVAGGIAAPLCARAAARLAARRPGRAATATTSGLVLAGGLLLRYAMIAGGRASADDPQATFAFTRAQKQEQK